MATLVSTLVATTFLIGAVLSGCPAVKKEDKSNKGYAYCGKENQATCTVGCNGGRVWYGGSYSIWFSTSYAYMSRELGPGESISCSNSGMDCDPFGGVTKKCYVENFNSLPGGLTLRYEDASCENNYNLGKFECPWDCARAAHSTPECSGSNRFIFDHYYSANHASWGCRCCRDNVFQTHGIWELYEYTDAVADAHPIFDEPAPWLEGPHEALPKGTMEIVMDRNVALGALAVLTLLSLSLSLSLCFYRRCVCSSKGAKHAVYRKVEMASSVDEDEPMM